MRSLLLVIFLLVLASTLWAQTPVETQNGRLVFELGTVQVPVGTEWRKVSEKEKTLYMGSRQQEVYMVTINRRKGALPAGNKAEAMQAYTQSYAEELGTMFKAKARDVRIQPGKKGCEFSFSFPNGVKVVGDYRQGKDVALVFTALNGSAQDLKAMASSFQSAPGKFKPPVYK